MSGYEQKLKKKSNPDFDRLQKLKKDQPNPLPKATILSRNPRFFGERVTRSWHMVRTGLEKSLRKHQPLEKSLKIEKFA